VSANGSSYDTITLGDGAGDTVFSGYSASSTIRVGNGATDSVLIEEGNGNTITLGDGAGDTVTAVTQGSDKITLGNGNGDVVTDASEYGSSGNTITVGNGNDTIYVGTNDTVTVGTGHDSFIFEQSIGAVTINHFNPSKDVITLSSQFEATVSYQDNSQGNAVITVDTNGDKITLVGVHAAALHTSDFHFA